jgi:hypothetical protein
MNENVKLKCKLLERNGSQVKVQSQLSDGASFDLWVRKHDIEAIEGSTPEECWLNCTYSGDHNKIASITLPAPALNVGHKVSVPMSLVRRHLFEGAKRPQTFRPITIPNSELGKLDLRKLSERTRKYRK